MKNLMVICAVGVCSLIIGVTVIAAESPLTPKKVITSEKEAAAGTTIPQEIVTDNDNALNEEVDLQQAAYNSEGCTFIDENHDGFCDNGDVHCHDGAHLDANHDGFCDYGDHYCMQDSNVNGSSICDNAQTVHHNAHQYSEDCAGNASVNQETNSHHSKGHHGGKHH